MKLNNQSQKTRSSARKNALKRNADEIMHEDEYLVACFDVARIAIGSSVKQHNCQIGIRSDGSVSFLYMNQSKTSVHDIDFLFEVEELHFFIDNTDDIECRSFVALKARKTIRNGLSDESSYEPEDSSSAKGFIVAEFQSATDIANFIRIVQKDACLASFFSNDNRLSRDRAHLYSKALISDAKTVALHRNKKAKSSAHVDSDKTEERIFNGIVAKAEGLSEQFVRKRLRQCVGTSLMFEKYNAEQLLKLFPGQFLRCAEIIAIAAENERVEGDDESRGESDLGEPVAEAERSHLEQLRLKRTHQMDGVSLMLGKYKPEQLAQLSSGQFLRCAEALAIVSESERAIGYVERRGDKVGSHLQKQHGWLRSAAINVASFSAATAEACRNWLQGAAHTE